MRAVIAGTDVAFEIEPVEREGFIGPPVAFPLENKTGEVLALILMGVSDNIAYYHLDQKEKEVNCAAGQSKTQVGC